METPCNNCVSNRFWLTLFSVLLGTRFFGFAPLASLFPIGFQYEFPLLLILLFFGYKYNDNSEYSKGLWLFLGAIVMNCISAFFFRNMDFKSSFSGGSFTIYIFFYFVITAIKPTIEETEKVIKYSGFIALILYYVQFAILPIPIVESLTSSWRAKDTVQDFDIVRFNITGESICFLYGLMKVNNLLERFCIKDVVIAFLILGMSVLHGYRNVIVAFVVGLVFLYIKVESGKIKKKTVFLAFFCVISVLLISTLPIFSDILTFMSDKTESQSETGLADIDRLQEFVFFFNQYLDSPLEWIFGTGFLQKEEYTKNAMFAFYNWVDLGFIGMSFMGGLYMVYHWIYLLCLNLRNVPRQYRYVNAFTVYLLLGSVFLNAAFSNQAPVIESLAFYLCYKIRLENYDEMLMAET